MKHLLTITLGVAAAAVFAFAGSTPAQAGGSWSFGLGYSSYGGSHVSVGYHSHSTRVHYHHHGYYYPHYRRHYVRRHYVPRYTRVYTTVPTYSRRTVTYTEPVTYTRKVTEYESRAIPEKTVVYEPVERTVQADRTTNVDRVYGRPQYERARTINVSNYQALGMITEKLEGTGLRYSEQASFTMNGQAITPDLVLESASGTPIAIVEYWSDIDVREGPERLRQLERLSREEQIKVYFIDAGNKAAIHNEVDRMITEIERGRDVTRPAASAAPRSATTTPARSSTTRSYSGYGSSR